jgi:formylglycine-generating enzyme required for sulfatase activity
MVVELAHTEPTIKVLDFGIARVGVGRHTQGLGPGTDPYSAPEQHAVRGAIGPWTDVFALGVTFLEMLLGTPDADDHGGSWWHRVREAGEPSRSLASMASRRAWPGPAVWAVLERALQREPSARHPHAGALRGDFLEALREDAEVTTVAPKRATPPRPSEAAPEGPGASWSEVTPVLLRSPSEHRGWRGERLPTGVLRGDEPDRYRVLDPTGASLEMVYIPPGWCQLGADDDTLHRLSRRAFLITEGFLVGRFPVTVEAFGRFVEATGYRTTEEVLGYRHAWRNPGYEPLDLVFTQGPSHPVVCVTWHDVMAWCRWAGLSLLTEAGWEYAARGPEGNPWPWGQEPPSPERLWWSGDGLRRESTAPVGSHPTGRSVWGVEDLCGGVWEWTADVWNPERRETSGPATAAPDPWSEGYATRPRARRGGGWWSVGERMVRAAARAPCGSALAAVDLGFRCALPLPGEVKAG